MDVIIIYLNFAIIFAIVILLDKVCKVESKFNIILKTITNDFEHTIQDIKEMKNMLKEIKNMLRRD